MSQKTEVSNPENLTLEELEALSKNLNKVKEVTLEELKKLYPDDNETYRYYYTDNL